MKLEQSTLGFDPECLAGNCPLIITQGLKGKVKQSVSNSSKSLKVGEAL